MVSIQLTGDIRRLNNKLRRLANIDFTGLNEQLAEGIKTSTRLRFKTSTDPEGKPWQSTARGGKILVLTARLRNSIRARADASGFAVGTNVIYAARHQIGDKRPLTIKAKTKRGLRFKVGGQWVNTRSVKVKMPARPFLGISKSDLEEIKTTLEQAVQEE